MDPVLTLDRLAAAPLQHQLADQLRMAIRDGRVPDRAQLPSTRSLARSLGVSRTVVVAAYDELFAEGYVEGRHGSGTFVATAIGGVRPRSNGVEDSAPGGSPARRWLAAPPPPAMPIPDPAPNMIEFRPGKPSVAPLPASVWRRIWRGVADQLPPDDYGPPGGDPEFRAAIADYLGWARGLVCQAEDVTITTGTVQAIDLIARATVRPGDPVGFEEPGPVAARNIFTARGAKVVPIPVDADGLVVECLPCGVAAPPVVYVTPSHQYPLGGRLPIARRLALLAWARDHDSLIVEDDYDSEFRFDAPPLPALAGLEARDNVVYVATFSKVLTPALRTGYVVAPNALRERIEALKPVSDYHTPWPVQRALTTFLAEGHLGRHVARMRRLYATKRSALLAALAPVSDLAQPRGIEAGLHVCLEFAPPLNACRVVSDARRQGVIVTPLDACFEGEPDRSGLVLGYGGLEVADIERGAAILVDSIRREAARNRMT